MSPSTARALPFFAAVAALVALGAGIYGCSRDNHSDRLSDQQAGVSQAGAENLAANDTAATARVDPAQRCASGVTYELLKRELFRRAAEIRGRDIALFDRLAAAAALRVERPVVKSRDEGLGSIACGASAAIDLPPGLAVAGGRTTLAADLDYTLQPAADGTGDVLTLANADAITIPLATLGRSAAASVAPITPAA
ncbi:MAG: hypothetical protein LC656_11005, partial [Sphingomonadales bacterium]|nr:hypothetical protein [Sphingomonadales bacterium]